MSYPTGTKVRLVKPWRVYSAGAVLEQGFYADLEMLVQAGIAERIDEAAEPARPGKLAAKAAKKIADTTKNLFGGNKP